MRNRRPGNGLWKGFMLLCIGCVLIAVGLSLGGHWTGLRLWPWHKGEQSYHYDWSFPGNDSDSEFHMDKPDENAIQDIADQGEAIPEGVRNIDVRLKAATLILKTGSEGTWSATDFEPGSLSVRVDGDTLRVEEEDWRHSIDLGSNFPKPRLEIVLPEGASIGKCRVSLGAGSVVASPLTVDELEMESGAGSIKGTEIVAGKATLKSGAGSVDLESCDFGETRMETGAGKIAYSGSVGDWLDVSTGAGAVDLKLSGSEDDYRIDYSRGLGSVRVGNESFSGVGDGSAGNRNADKKIRLSSGIGSVRVEFETE